VCGHKSARVLDGFFLKKNGRKASYVFETDEAVFCTKRCAAAWALKEVQGDTEIQNHWCDRHGWYSGEDPCFECTFPVKEQDQ